jgi:hypothetical protein
MLQNSGVSPIINWKYARSIGANGSCSLRYIELPWGSTTPQRPDEIQLFPSKAKANTVG